MANTRSKTVQLAIHALLAAIILAVSFLPIKTLGLEITLSMVPIAVGAALYGPKAGAFLGGVFGVVSYLQCLGYSPFGAALFAIDPFLTALVCIPTRILAGWLAGVLAKVCKNAFDKNGKSTVSHIVGSVSAPILNTVFFMSVLCLCFYNTEFIQSMRTTLGASNVITFVLMFVGINGLAEILAGVVLALPITKAVSKVAR